MNLMIASIHVLVFILYFENTFIKHVFENVKYVHDFEIQTFLVQNIVFCVFIIYQI